MDLPFFGEEKYHAAILCFRMKARIVYLHCYTIAVAIET